MPVTMSLGFDHVNLMSPVSYLCRPGVPEQHPQAMKTKLGWYIFRASATTDLSEIRANIRFVCTNEPDVHQWYEANVCGVKPTNMCVRQ